MINLNLVLYGYGFNDSSDRNTVSYVHGRPHIGGMLLKRTPALAISNDKI